MASAAVGKGHGPTNTNVSRKKTPGACERCREKRIKVSTIMTFASRNTNQMQQCNGAQPCDQCSKKELQCIFTFAPTTGTDALAEYVARQTIGQYLRAYRKLDLILARIDRLEQCYKEQAKCQQVQVPHKLVAPGEASTTLLTTPLLICKATKYPSPLSVNGLAQVNQQTGCVEFYGPTSSPPLA